MRFIICIWMLGAVEAFVTFAGKERALCTTVIFAMREQMNLSIGAGPSPWLKKSNNFLNSENHLGCSAPGFLAI